MTPDTLIHVGYHKTATTWLQKHLFNNRKMGFAMRNGRRRLMREFVLKHPARFDAKRARTILDRRGLIKAHDTMMPVVSLERLIGSPHTGGFDSTLIADRLHRVFPQGGVLMVIREQQTIIASTYKQYVRAGGLASLPSYLAPSRVGNEHIPAFRLEHFQYHHLISVYQGLFGKDRVLVLPYEMLRQSPEIFVNRILDFCGIQGKDASKLPLSSRTHASMSSMTTDLKRLLNFLVAMPSRYHYHVPFKLSNDGRQRLNERLEWLDQRLPLKAKKRSNARHLQIVANLTKNKFAHSNRITSELIGVRLADYGYTVD